MLQIQLLSNTPKNYQEFKKCNGAQMTPMAQTYVLGIVYGLVNDKQFEWL